MISAHSGSPGGTGLETLHKNRRVNTKRHKGVRSEASGKESVGNENLNVDVDKDKHVDANTDNNNVHET